jgi:single-stranded-DNA-specific exonuclease
MASDTAKTIRLKDRPQRPEARARLIASGLDPVLADCLARRGIDDPTALDPALQRLFPARGLLHMEDAADQIGTAILAGASLLVVGDYDADGATATALLVRGLQRLGARVSFRVPDRFRFGYGLTPGLVQEIAAEANSGAQSPDDASGLAGLPDWIITVDNGISSIAGVAAAQALGIQVLVTDHHLPGPQLPETLIINPHLPGCGFPSKNLAGVGVAFYFLVAIRAWLAQRNTGPGHVEMARIDDLLPLVALGTVADLVRLDENNRRLVAQGLLRIQRGLAPPGLLALFTVAGRLPAQATAHDLGFFIGPRLNAAGRMSDMAIGIRCLLTDDPQEALQAAGSLHALNQSRRDLQALQTETASVQAETLLQRQDAVGKALVLFDDQWHQGVVGLIAGRIKDQTHRPTLAFAPAEPGAELLKGSGRSIAGVHLRDLLARIDSLAPGLMTAFGGHAMAAGLSLPRSRLTEFTQLVRQVADEVIDEAFLSPELLTDGPLPTHGFSLSTAKLLSSQIWGQGFPAPVFCNQFLVRQQRLLKDRHLRLELVLADDPRQRVSGIWFDGPRVLPNAVRLAFSLGVNDYLGTESIQIVVHAAEELNPLH